MEQPRQLKIPARPPLIGRMLLDSGKITEADLQNILRTQKERGIRFGDAAVLLRLVKDEDIRTLVDRQFDYVTLRADSDTLDPAIVSAFRIDDRKTEIYKSLRSQLILRWFSDHQSLIISSTTRNSAAGITSANLAVLFSQLGEKTLLIDANMRRPCQHALFRLPNKTGLSDVLAKRIGSKAIQSIQNFKNLSVLTSGTPVSNSLELLTKKGLWQKFEQFFDIIIIDAPPVLEYSEAALMASELKGILLVEVMHQSRVVDIEQARDQLKIARAELVGAVIVEDEGS